MTQTSPGERGRAGESTRFRVAFAQMDLLVGDIDANCDEIRAAWAWAKEQRADLLVTPEMALPGYQAQDLILRPGFLDKCDAALEQLRLESAADGAPALLVGAPYRGDEPDRGTPYFGDVSAPFNAAHLLDGGARSAVIRKQILPNYGVFDEHRLFRPAPPQGPVGVRGVRIGFPVCEDAWHAEPCETLAESGAELLIVINGSPYARGKHDRERMPNMVARVIETGLPLLYVNRAGAQDDQVFDGSSFCLNPGGALAEMAPAFAAERRLVEFEKHAEGWRALDGEKSVPPDGYESDYRAMVEAVRAYWRKNGMQTALLGLSGGVDSALVAAIATDALGPENVSCFMLPSQFTSRESLEDAAAVARNLGCALDEIAISAAVDAVETALAAQFAGAPRDVAEENIQSRMRGLLLMAISNKTGALLLTTGNKSEVAVGYATLYGDMCGAYNPLKDLYKTRVFETCRWRNSAHRDWMRGPAGAVIPSRVIDKPPSAELRADQKDEDSLPPYEVLDAILERLIERDQTIDEIVAEGFERETVSRVAWLLRISEHKRFQSAPGPKLTTRAFWLERRYPLTNGDRG